jgi:hypothetical protein
MRVYDENAIFEERIPVSKNMNKRLISLLFLLWCGFYPQVAHAQQTGLRFYGQEFPLDQRTGLKLTPETPIAFETDIQLAFDLRFVPGYNSYFGYIFRIIINNQNIDFIYSSHEYNLNMVVGEEISEIAFRYPLENIKNQWIPVKLEIRKSDNKIALTFDDITYLDDYPFEEGKSNLSLFFGAHSFNRFNSTDLPNMIIRNIKLFQNEKLAYSWPLDQSKGTNVKEVVHRFNGIARNPHWILNSYQNWQLQSEFSLAGRILYGYNNRTSKILMVQQDSIYSYNVTDHSLDAFLPEVEFAADERFNLVYDSIKNQFLLYSLKLNLKVPLSEAAAVKERPMKQNDDPIYMHHNRLVNPENDVLYTFGGYGQLTYANKVFAYNDFTGEWFSIKYNGTFHPRYLAGAGYHPLDTKLYILGGYGSKSGKQTISPGYYYDLITYSFKENRFETLHEFPDDEDGFCFGNSLHIDTSTSTLYGLKFSRFETNPAVQAVAVSLEDYSLKNVGNKFNFNFLDINSQIDLFYDDADKTLTAFTTYFDGTKTNVKIHQISYPPLAAVTSSGTENAVSGNLLRYLLIFLLVVLSIAFYLIIKRRKLKNTGNENPETPDFSNSTVAADAPDIAKNDLTGKKQASVIVFGGFQVINNQGVDITNAFTPLLKELFLYIMLSTLSHGKGVSSKTLDEVFWFDKSPRAAGNNRAVNMGRLRALIADVGGCALNKETGYWKIQFNPALVYCDFFEYIQLINSGKIKKKEGIYSLLKIIQDGPALQNIHADWLDKYKLDISNAVTDNIIEYISKEGKTQDADFIVRMADALLMFDIVNEEAMIVKCKTFAQIGKHSLAKAAYHNFAKEYHHLYNEAFPKSFNQILEEDVS